MGARGQDAFSPLPTLRGSDWRGRDCNDRDAAVHPGARPLNQDMASDSNCNGPAGTGVWAPEHARSPHLLTWGRPPWAGIYGVDPQSGEPYETLLCSGTGEKGVIVLGAAASLAARRLGTANGLTPHTPHPRARVPAGDSASAHFHIPPAFFEVQAWGNHTFHNLLFMGENEFDWPMLSASTAFFANTSQFPDISGAVNSSYAVFRSRNLCNHRDYQNIAVNGARVGDMNSTIVRSMARNQQGDKPVVAIYALIGNDVCNGGGNDTVAHMTPPDQYHDSVVATFQYLVRT